jgi:hypothetical protein
MATYKILDVRKIPTRDAKRAGQFDTLITYTDPATSAAYLAIVPGEKPSDAAIKAVIQEEAKHRLNLIGKEITI